ncbi:glutathione peroxidase [Sporobacter termitidis DSM 10068]|uniref:Glutathione peroxidase n=1 Tax=Sporobacter termitidis DSM 10068 TaxID=1123282 RepID=A0A1M5XPM4_9FIRM|nr:redoxin domain-containing protein [Sporobacter termitidis]SHI01797.1 glutathione peroxidase [Sporobacter termitidis DSM 10068]
MDIYDFTVKDENGQDVALTGYKGRVLLIVNTATGCPYTSQYDGLQILYTRYKDKGFEILDFPCYQFMEQEADAEEIYKVRKVRFGVTFPQFGKVYVSGPREAPLYTYLKAQKKALFGTADIKLNFTKFLVDKTGAVLKRYSPDVKLQKIEKDIEKLLAVN